MTYKREEFHTFLRFDCCGWKRREATLRLPRLRLPIRFQLLQETTYYTILPYTMTWQPDSVLHRGTGGENILMPLDSQLDCYHA
jgi:hypothetical protein